MVLIKNFDFFNQTQEGVLTRYLNGHVFLLILFLNGVVLFCRVLLTCYYLFGKYLINFKAGLSLHLKHRKCLKKHTAKLTIITKTCHAKHSYSLLNAFLNLIYFSFNLIVGIIN